MQITIIKSIPSIYHRLFYLGIETYRLSATNFEQVLCFCTRTENTQAQTWFWGWQTMPTHMRQFISIATAQIHKVQNSNTRASWKYTVSVDKSVFIFEEQFFLYDKQVLSSTIKKMVIVSSNYVKNLGADNYFGTNLLIWGNQIQ